MLLFTNDVKMLQQTFPFETNCLKGSITVGKLCGQIERANKKVKKTRKTKGHLMILTHEKLLTNTLDMDECVRIFAKGNRR